MTRQNTFTQIYKDNVWNNNNPNIPKSGPGSSMKNSKKTSHLLDTFVNSYNIQNVTDLGCGDLTWMSQSILFKSPQVNYVGYDIVEELIYQHKQDYPNKTFICDDIVVNEKSQTDLVIIRDVIFHMTNDEIQSLFKSLHKKFKYICITTCHNSDNYNKLNQWHYAERNISIEPFNIPTKNAINKVYEKSFNRDIIIMSHDDFYLNYHTV